MYRAVHVLQFVSALVVYYRSFSKYGMVLDKDMFNKPKFVHTFKVQHSIVLVLYGTHYSHQI